MLIVSTFANRYKPTRRAKFAKELPPLLPGKNYFLKSPSLLKKFKNAKAQPIDRHILNLTMTAKLNTDNGCKIQTTRTPACNRVDAPARY